MARQALFHPFSGLNRGTSSSPLSQFVVDATILLSVIGVLPARLCCAREHALGSYPWLLSRVCSASFERSVPRRRVDVGL